jgi:nicotinamide mononucleotide (NMN) deamidase PncC
MARGAVARFGASMGVSITGVAGPEPDEDGNPVGLVYCGVARRDGGATSKRLDCTSSKPEGVIDKACLEAMRFLRSFSFS